MKKFYRVYDAPATEWTEAEGPEITVFEMYGDVGMILEQVNYHEDSEKFLSLLQACQDEGAIEVTEEPDHLFWPYDYEAYGGTVPHNELGIPESWIDEDIPF